MQIQRVITQKIIEQLRTTSKAVVIYGPRQVGKTTLCNFVIEKLGLKTLSINADEKRYIDVLSSRDSRKLIGLVSGYELLFIDEAQRIPEIGINLKIMIDKIKGLKILTTGSSSFELANQIGEPLTGRKWTYHLFPIAQMELAATYNNYELASQLEERLIWGSYPEIFSIKSNERREHYMHQLTSDYLYKDLLSLQDIRNSDKIKSLLRLLAFQVGNEVSLNELAGQLSLSKETVHRYLDLLEKTFIIFKLGGFSRNLRKEVTKMHKYYFYDVGVRNSLIDNFRTLSERDDLGKLWENFLIVERLKANHYRQNFNNSYFWRTYTGAEIDYLEEGGGELAAYEFKWREKNKRAPKKWLEEYKNSSWRLINQDNWLDFVL